jgi:hypothetical protein
MNRTPILIAVWVLTGLSCVLFLVQIDFIFEALDKVHGLLAQKQVEITTEESSEILSWFSAAANVSRMGACVVLLNAALLWVLLRERKQVASSDIAPCDSSSAR